MDHMNDEHDLWIATRRYMLGEISIDELRAVEQPFNDAFKRALLVLAKRQLMEQWRFRRIWRKR